MTSDAEAHQPDPDDDKAHPQTMPDKPGDDPRDDIEDAADRLPRGPRSTEPADDRN